VDLVSLKVWPSLARRDTARVILASPGDRVLLFRHFLPVPLVTRRLADAGWRY